MRQTDHRRSQAFRRGPDRGDGEGAFRPGLDYVVTIILAWLLPGAGHWSLGQRTRGVLLGALILGTFWWGELIAGGYAVERKEHPIFFIGQVGAGASAFLADWIPPWADVGGTDSHPPGAPQSSIDRRIPQGLPMGILLTSISGLLNVLVVLRVMDPRAWERRPPGVEKPDAGRRQP
jgi:hypothetical protein